MVPSRATSDVLGGHLDGLRQLGAVLKADVYDGEAAFSVRRAGRPVLTEASRRSGAPTAVCSWAR